MVERGHKELVSVRKLQSSGKGLGSVLVVTENECRVEPDVLFIQIAEGIFITTAHRVELLFHLTECFAIQAFETDQ